MLISLHKKALGELALALLATHYEAGFLVGV